MSAASQDNLEFETPGDNPHTAGLLDAAIQFGVHTVDRFIPAEVLGGESEPLRRARTIVGFAFVLIVLAIESAGYFHFVLHREASSLIELVFGASISMLVFLPMAFRLGRTTAPAANLVIAAMFTSLVVAIASLGGIRSPLFHWCGMAPMLAVLMGAKRSAWIWAGLGIACVGAFIALDAGGVTLASTLSIDQSSGSNLWMHRSIDFLSWLTVLMITSLIYERHKDEQTHRVANKNDELEHEVEQRKRAEERTRYLAYYDELTTLPNRQLFKEHLAQAMDSADREDCHVGLLFLDLDGFKEINDTHGHSIGDKLLQQVSVRLLGCVRGIDRISRQATEDREFLSRLGGDEFTILLDRLNHFSEAAIVASRVIEGLAEPFHIESHEIHVSASIGIAIYGESLMSLDELLRNADLAMYHAKKEGRNNFQFFEASMNETVVAHTSLARALRRALEHKELELHYQPIVAGDGETIVAVECLARWHHPTRGYIAPEQFIAVAEKSGLIVELGDWVINEACEQFGRWKKLGIEPKRMAINVSGQQFRDQHIVGTLTASAREAEIDPHSLEIEITETAMMIDEAEALRCLTELKALGVSIALDDFGTGYSSLSYVKRFPVDALKIDRSFVDSIESNPEANAIAMAILAIAQRLGLRVVAEGVEHESQAKLLREESCEEFQGFLYSRPVPGREMTELLRTGIGQTAAQGA